MILAEATGRHICISEHLITLTNAGPALIECSNCAAASRRCMVELMAAAGREIVSVPETTWRSVARNLALRPGEISVSRCWK